MDDREILEQELRQTRLAFYKATEMSKFKAGFLARTAHELRSPLASIISLHQLILTDLCENPQEERDFLQQAHQAALKLTQLLDRTIFISQLEDGKIEIEKREFLLSDLLADLKQSISLQAANRNVRLNFSENSDNNLQIIGDYNCLLQMSVLLLESAIFQVKSTDITLSTKTIPEIAAVSIDIQLASTSQIWLESIDLCQDRLNDRSVNSETLDRDNDFSPSMKFLLAQQMMEKMGGNLKLTEFPAENSLYLTQFSFCLPLAEI